MLLCLDVGNSHVYGGVFSGEQLQCSFRFNSQQSTTSDEIGVFLRSVLKENAIAIDDIDGISYCSVVPEKDYSFRAACIKYINIDPFVIKPGIKTGLQIQYKNTMEVGADRIANAISAVHSFPKCNTLIIDLGTATTLCAINQHAHYLGGIIMPGMKISVEALRNNTAKLPYVEIAKVHTMLGRSTTESIQSGIYYTQLATIKFLKNKLIDSVFNGDQHVVVLGTGGFAHLFDDSQVFTAIVPDLVLHGLRLAFALNHEEVSYA